MATFNKLLLSGSTNGRNIKIVATATAGTLIHTAVSGTDDLDEIYIEAVNNHTQAVLLTIEWGGVTSPDDLIPVLLQPKLGKYVVISGLCLQNGLVVRAFADVANVVCINGYVHRISA